LTELFAESLDEFIILNNERIAIFHEHSVSKFASDSLDFPEN